MIVGLIIATQLATGTLAGTATTATPPRPTVTLELQQPRWVRHRVTPGERLVDIAGRYGVTVEDIKTWNHIEGRARILRQGKRLRIQARRLPPPRQRIRYIVQRGETWREIAIRYGVDSKMLRSYNYRTKRLHRGAEIAVWVDPGAPVTVGAHLGPPVPDRFTLPRDARSMGRPQIGRIVNSVQLPESPHYTRLHPKWLYGSSHTLLQLQSAIANFRHDSGFEGELIVGSISRWGGGKFEPHRSHQSGRDVDIRLPLRPGVGRKGNPWPEEIDWAATWALVSALVDTGQVQFIFLEKPLQHRLYEAARHMGVDHDTLADVIHEYDKRRYSHAVVRHEKGHDGHIHVRFRCGPQEPHCRG